MDIVLWVGAAWYEWIINTSFSPLGGRGVTLQQYLNITGSDLTDLYSAVKFPDSPDRYSVNPSFQSELPVRCGCLFVGLLFSVLCC